MKNLLVLIFLFYIIVINCSAQSYRELISEAEEFYRSKEYQKSSELYQQAFRLETKNPSELYNGARSAALSGDVEDAFKFLGLSIEKGWTNIDRLKKDTDLSSLHSDKRWNKLVRNLQKKMDVIEANYDKPLQKELLAIYEDDQNIRQQFIAALNQWGQGHRIVDSISRIGRYKDSINLVRITKILNERGWVGRDKIGARANQTLFMVIKHSEDLKTQQKYLPMMRDAVKKGNAMGSDLALLEDAVALDEGRKQIYGTQMGIRKDDNYHYIRPLEDPDNVDKRRAEVGLGPIATYVKQWNIIWNVEEYKKQLPELEKLNEKN
jgi:hypothetical protein